MYPTSTRVYSEFKIRAEQMLNRRRDSLKDQRTQEKKDKDNLNLAQGLGAREAGRISNRVQGKGIKSIVIPTVTVLIL